MAVEGGMKCVKIFLFIFNLLFFIAGIALIVVGAVIQAKFREYVLVLGTQFSVAPLIIIAVGVIIFIVAFFGCCGAYKENACMITTFVALMVVILLVELTGGIVAIVMRGKAVEMIGSTLLNTLPAFYSKPEIYGPVFNRLQGEFKCCGVNSANDWVNAKGYNNSLPFSCCSDGSSSCTVNSNSLYKQGCIDGFSDYCKSNIGVVAGIGIGVCVIEIIGIVLACCLAHAVKQSYEAV